MLGLISANQTSPPTYLTQLAEAANVIGVVITLSPGFNPKDKTAACNAEVPLLTATAWFTPIYSEKAFSKSLILGPWVIKSDLRVLITESISFLSICCFAYGIFCWVCWEN